MESLMIDNGSSACRAGFVGNPVPSVELSSIERHDGTENDALVINDIDSYVGNYGQSRRDVDYPINKGLVTDFDNLEKMWQHIFRVELKTEPENYNIHMTAHHNSKKDRENMTELMFETFNAPGFYISFQPLLSMYAAGYINGVSVCSGEGVTNIVSVCEGYVDPKAMVASDMVGSRLTEYLSTVLKENGHNFTIESDKKIVQNIKENLCYVNSNNYDQSMKSYELPDGETIELGGEATRCPEVLFKPSIIGEGSYSLHECIYNSIASSDINIRKTLYGNILLSGGNMLFPGMAERIHEELTPYAPATTKINVKTTDDTNTVWLGGSILSGLSTFDEMWITKQEYDTFGLQILSKLYP